MSIHDWNPGYILSDEEWEVFYDEFDVEPVFVTSPQPNPGVSFSAPEGEVGIFRSTNDEFFEMLDPFAGEPGQIRYLGKHLNQQDAAQAAVNFINDESYETPVAVFFNFDASRFTNAGDLVEAIPDYFWARSAWLEPEIAKFINAKLIESNPVYRRLTEFLLNPEAPEFTELKSDVIKNMDFSRVY